MAPTSHTSIVWIPVAERTGMHVPALVLSDGQFLAPAVDYSIQLLRNCGLATVIGRIRAIALLFDFHSAMYGDALPPEDEQARFFHLFAHAVQNGTVARDGGDPTGLGWRPRPVRRARRIIDQCAHFIEFLASQSNVTGLGGFDWVVRQVIEEGEARRGHFAAYSLLAHLRRTGSKRRPWLANGGAIAESGRRAIGFPAENIQPLISSTLENRRASEAARVRNALALILLAYGGIRSSELFHIWVSDISYHGPVARVFVRHPSEFHSKVDGRRVKRQVVLASQYGLLPRHLLPPGDRLRAGWKGMSSDYDKSALVHWIDPSAGVLFTELHKLWITKLRPSASDHPYYFVTVDRDGDYGGPWTLAGFRDSFRSACARIGLRPDQSKGINPHGLRHAYGLKAESMGFPSSVIQEMMHHVSPLSQEVYKQKSPEQVDGIIDEASRRIKNGEQMLPPTEEQGWLSDPRKLFNNWRRG